MPKEYIDRLRQQNPGAYDDLSDQELASRVIAKHPEYKDVLGDVATPAKQPDAVGRAKAFLTKPPEQPRFDLLEYLTGKRSTDLFDAGPAVRAAGDIMLPESYGGAARDLALLAVPGSQFAKGGKLGAGAANFANKHQTLAPALERILYSTAQPVIESGDVARGGMQGAASAGTDALFSLLGAKRGIGNYVRSHMPGKNVQVHQDVNPPNVPQLFGPYGRPLPPSSGSSDIVVNRVVPGGKAPTVYGGGGASVSPTEVRVAPPAQGSWVNAPGQPPSPNAAVRVSEPVMPIGNPDPAFGQGFRGAASIAANENPETTIAGEVSGLALLNALRKQIPLLGGGHGNTFGTIPVTP